MCIELLDKKQRGGRRRAQIKEIPDHAPIRGKGVNTGLVRQTWGMSLFGPM